MASNSLTTLLKQSSLDDHEEVLKACNASLKQSKENLEAQHAKVIALIKLERYEDALRIFEGGGDGLKKKAPLEQAYAFFKTGDFNEARKIARNLTGSRGAMHVEAQASYRLEDFARAAELYETLAQNPAGLENENDLRINGAATDAHLEWKMEGHLAKRRKSGREDMEAFETAYNAACGSIARGEFGQSEVLLRRAKDLCNSLEDLSDNEKEAELLPIEVQQLYVLHQLRKDQEAENLAAQIVIRNIPDPSTQHVAQNNKSISVIQSGNPYLTHRLFHSVGTLPKTDKLFSFQSNTMLQNSLSLDLLAAKYTGVTRSTSKFIPDQATTMASVNGFSVINAAAKAQCQLGKFGIKRMLPLLEQRPSDVGLVLTVVQLYILTNNHGSAIAVMESLLKRLAESTAAPDQDVRFAPGLVAVILSLYSLQGRKSHIKTELVKAASYWRHKSKPPITLLRAAGLSLLESCRPEDLAIAGDIFESLHKEDPNDRIALAGYIASYSTTFPSKVTPKVDKLTPISRLIAGINTTALEAAGVPQPGETTGAKISRKRDLEEKSKPAKKRTRKSKLPKNYDPGKAPDPERWLPLKDRSTYKPKNKKGRQKAAALTQGGIGDSRSESPHVATSDGVIKPSSSVVSGSSKAKKKKPKK